MGTRAIAPPVYSPTPRRCHRHGHKTAALLTAAALRSAGAGAPGGFVAPASRVGRLRRCGKAASYGAGVMSSAARGVTPIEGSRKSSRDRRRARPEPARDAQRLCSLTRARVTIEDSTEVGRCADEERENNRYPGGLVFPVRRVPIEAEHCHPYGVIFEVRCRSRRTATAHQQLRGRRPMTKAGLRPQRAR